VQSAISSMCAWRFAGSVSVQGSWCCEVSFWLGKTVMLCKNSCAFLGCRLSETAIDLTDKTLHAPSSCFCARTTKQGFRKCFAQMFWLVEEDVFLPVILGANMFLAARTYQPLCDAIIVWGMLIRQEDLSFAFLWLFLWPILMTEHASFLHDKLSTDNSFLRKQIFFILLQNLQRK